MTQVQAIFSERCWINGRLQPATIHIKDGRISAIDQFRSPGAFDVGNNVLMPGVIDAHVHVNEPGRTEWEGFETATKAAAAGGITCIADMPLNASPVTTNISALNAKLDATKDKLWVNTVFYGGLIPGNLKEIAALLRAGVSGIKCFLVHSGIDEFPNVSRKDLEAAMPVIAQYKRPLLAHCEIYDEEVQSGLDEKPDSYNCYLNSRPCKWENDAIEMMIDLARQYQCPVHIVHVSSAEALPLIAAAKKEHLPVTAETCAHYIYFNAEDIPDKNTLYKCAPPIRNRENNQQLKKALADGILDFIATDHSPAPPDIKEIGSGNLKKAWGGIAGLQFLLPASWTAMKDILTLEQFIPLLTSKPARFLQLETKGEIKPGHDADFVIWSPEEKFTIEAAAICHRHRLSPYVGEQLNGLVKQTIVNGRFVYNEADTLNVEKTGKALLFPVA